MNGGPAAGDAVVVVLAFLVLGGCIAPEATTSENTSDEPQIEWGLGLDMSADWPRPAGFHEPDAEVDYWYSQIVGLYPLLLEGCSNAPEIPETKLPRSVGYLVFHADCGFHETAIRSTEAQIRLSGSLATVEEWRMAALHDVEATTARLSNLSTYSNISTTEIAAIVMEMQFGQMAILKSAEKGYREIAVNGSTEGLGLVLAHYDNIRSVGKYLQRLVSELGTEDACRGPTLDWQVEVIAALESLAVRYEDRRNAEEALEDDYLGRSIGLQVHRARTAATLGWWPYLVAAKGSIPVHESNLRHLDDTRLPTFAEALWMWALYANDTRSIWTDRSLEVMFSPEDGPQVWMLKPNRARMLLALDALEWPFAAVPCNGPPIT